MKNRDLVLHAHGQRRGLRSQSSCAALCHYGRRRDLPKRARPQAVADDHSQARGPKESSARLISRITTRPASFSALPRPLRRPGFSSRLAISSTHMPRRLHLLQGPVALHDCAEDPRPSRSSLASRVRFGVTGTDENLRAFLPRTSARCGLFVKDDNPPQVGSLILIEFRAS